MDDIEERMKKIAFCCRVCKQKTCNNFCNSGFKSSGTLFKAKKTVAFKKTAQKVII